MTRNLKTLGTALLAILAIGAVTASAASAQFHSTEKEVTLTVESNETQTFHYTEGGVAISCGAIAFDGDFVGTEEDAASHEWTGTDVTATDVTYSNDCTALGLTMDYEFNGCHYTFTLADGETTGTADLRCEGTKPFVTETVTTGTGGIQCQYKLEEQNNIPGTIHFENKTEAGTANETVTLNPTSTGIVGTKTAGGLLCGPATSNTGTYSGKINVIGEEPGTTNRVPLWVS